MNIIKYTLVILSLFALASCKKDTKTVEPTPEPAPTTGNLKINFANKVGTANLSYNTTYTIQSGDSISITKFKYYISNIVLTKSDNSTYTVPNSYDIIDPAVKTAINLTNVPIANYKSVQFIIGVDSARNKSGAQDGDLAPNKDMFWSWNTGYIFLKLEGTSPQSSASNKSVIYHIGGFSGLNKGIRTVTINFGSSTANVNSSGTPAINLNTDVLEIFKNPSPISISSLNFQMSVNASSKMIADNYADMITFGSITN